VDFDIEKKKGNAMQNEETRILTDFTAFMRSVGIRKLTIELDHPITVEKKPEPPDEKGTEKIVEDKCTRCAPPTKHEEKKEKPAIEKKNVEKTKSVLSVTKKNVNLLDLFFNAFDLTEAKVELNGERVPTSSLIDHMSLDELKQVINQLELGIDVDQPISKLREVVSAPIKSYFGE
jgi:hypothetical protein